MDAGSVNKEHVQTVKDACSSLFVVACLCGVYAAYYLFYVVKKPTIACRNAKFLRFLEQHVPISKESFWPTWWCFESRFQTVFRAFLQSSAKVHYESEFVKTPDGGEIQLDWSYNDKYSMFPKETRPTILLLPGLTGSSRENYMLNMVKDATDLGYRCVVFVNRGLGKSTLKTPKTYCATSVDDPEFVIDLIKQRFPQTPLMATGVSMGGMILLNYLAKTGEHAKIDAAMVVSVSWNVFAAVKELSTPINNYLFNRTLARALCDLVKRNLQMLENHMGLDTNHVLESKTIQDFDERFTTKMFGYETRNDYYSAASPDFKIPKIRKPVLCLSAADDPFQPGHAVPMCKAQVSDHVAIVLTSHGGHIGFLEGTFPRNHNYMNRWFKQYASAVFSHGFKD